MSPRALMIAICVGCLLVVGSAFASDDPASLDLTKLDVDSIAAQVAKVQPGAEIRWFSSYRPFFPDDYEHRKRVKVAVNPHWEEGRIAYYNTYPCFLTKESSSWDCESPSELLEIAEPEVRSGSDLCPWPLTGVYPFEGMSASVFLKFVDLVRVKEQRPSPYVTCGVRGFCDLGSIRIDRHDRFEVYVRTRRSGGILIEYELECQDAFGCEFVPANCASYFH